MFGPARVVGHCNGDHVDHGARDGMLGWTPSRTSIAGARTVGCAGSCAGGTRAPVSPPATARGCTTLWP